MFLIYFSKCCHLKLNKEHTNQIILGKLKVEKKGTIRKSLITIKWDKSTRIRTAISKQITIMRQNKLKLYQ